MADKYQTLATLRKAGLPVPPALAVHSPDEVSPALLHNSLGTKPGATYAVRSSHDAEDGAGRSYAGQFLTLLDVCECDVADAVRKVLTAYGKETAYGVSGEPEALDSPNVPTRDHHVVIQPMVHAVISGVAFTSNPEGFLDEAVVVLGRGLGEGVVSDKVATQTMYFAEDGSTWHYGSLESDSAPNSPTKATKTARRALALAHRCREILGYETDMEFAVESSGKLKVLQARPITMLGGVPAAEALEHRVLLDNSNIIESYPGVVLPLTQSFARSMYRRIFTAAVKRLTGDDALVHSMEKGLRDMLVFCDWHAYYRMASWYAILSLLPFSHAIKRTWRKSLGVTDDAGDEGGARVRIGTKAHVCGSVLRHTFAAPRLTRETCDSIEGYLDDAEARIRDASSMGELLRTYDDLCERVLSVWDITLFNDMHAFVFTALAGGARPAGAGVASLAPICAMGGLVDTARAHGLDSEEYQRERECFLREFGDRTMGELKLETRTWRTNPELIDAHVQGELASTREPPHDDDLETQRTAHSKNPFASQARKSVAMRERSRLMRTRMFGLVRTIFLRCADALKERGVLEETRDVFYLTVDEVRDATFQTAEFAADGRLRTLVDLRKRREVIVKTLPILHRLWVTGNGPWEHTMPAPANSSDSLEDRAETDLNEGSVLLGTGTSKGEVTGEVLLIKDADMMAESAGKIIVAVSTDPGWAFILRNAVAIIAERGSLLSHTAIISRELGIPAVVGIHNATHLLKNGDVVRVNGNDGCVTLLHRG